MKFGVNTFLFTSRFTTEDTAHFKNIKALGFDGVEITMQEPGDFDPKQVREALDDAGLQCLCLCGLMIDRRDLRGGDEEQKTAAAFIQTVVDTARMLGAPLVSGPLYSVIGRCDRITEEEYRRQRTVVAGHLSELCAYAAGKGVTLGIEPLIRFETDFINTAAEARQLVDMTEAENLGIHLDTFHMNVEETSISNAVLTAGEKLQFLHISDNNRGAPGTGTFNWKELAAPPRGG